MERSYQLVECMECIQEQLRVQEFLKLQQQEKARQKEIEKQERYELQRQQEIDAKVCCNSGNDPVNSCNCWYVTAFASSIQAKI